MNSIRVCEQFFHFFFKLPAPLEYKGFKNSFILSKYLCTDVVSHMMFLCQRFSPSYNTVELADSTRGVCCHPVSSQSVLKTCL